MATVTHVCTIDYVAKMLGEDVALLEAIIPPLSGELSGALIISNSEAGVLGQ